jgi:hypothetical protein
MRRTVSVEMLSTIPSSTSFFDNSLESHCERDLPLSSGRSQAIFTRCTATSGGEKRLLPSTRFVLKSAEPVLLKPFGPFIDWTTGNPDHPSNLGDRHSITEQEDDPAPPGQADADGCRPLPGFKHFPLFGGEKNDQTCFTTLGHDGLLLSENLIRGLTAIEYGPMLIIYLFTLFCGPVLRHHHPRALKSFLGSCSRSFLESLLEG